MITYLPAKRKGRGRASEATAKRPPAPLTLVSASFDPDGPEVYLTFDRPIDISGLVVGGFGVVDEPDGHALIGFLAPILIAPNQVQVLMQIVASASGPDVLLTASAGNGIVAVDDGGTWAGASDLVLPFDG
jgi:hypothetical protein